MKTKRILRAICVSTGALCLLGVILFMLITSPLIPIRGWKKFDPRAITDIRHTVTVLDNRDRIIESDLYDVDKVFVPLSEIPLHTQKAFVAVEDKRFRKHKGVDYVRMLGALKANIRAGARKEGASTITQQLIKNTHLSSEKTIKRKLQEIRLAKAAEKQFDKDEILEAYLNILYFGNSIYGIGRAARRYFGKTVGELTISESALLAGIINNPALYNPLQHADRALKRRNTVLDCMERCGALSSEETKAQKESELSVQALRISTDTFVESCIEEAAGLLGCGKSELFAAHPTIYTHADLGKINTISSTMSDIVLENDINFRCCIVDNLHARLCADVGNRRGCFEIRRQPGSAIKPIFGYAAALERRLVTPATVLRDEKRAFGSYTPQNFQDVYYGSVTVSDSLKQSLNIPAVTLADACGIPYCKAVASRFGVPFSVGDDGLALALGGMRDGVTLHELADAYATLARGGMYAKSGLVREIRLDGVTVYKDNRRESVRAVGEDTAFLLTEMLRDCAKSGTAQELRAFDNVAAKTGTVERGQKNSDAYCIAYTPRYTVAVWLGIEENSDRKLYGGREPARIAEKVLSCLGDTTPFAIPKDVVRLDVDAKKLFQEGEVYLAAPSLPQRYRVPYYFSKKNLPKRFSYESSPESPDFFDDTKILQNFEIVDAPA